MHFSWLLVLFGGRKGHFTWMCTFFSHLNKVCVVYVAQTALRRSFALLFVHNHYLWNIEWITQHGLDKIFWRWVHCRMFGLREISPWRNVLVLLSNISFHTVPPYSNDAPTFAVSFNKLKDLCLSMRVDTRETSNLMLMNLKNHFWYKFKLLIS